MTNPTTKYLAISFVTMAGTPALAAYGPADSSGGTDPILLVGGAVIILLLAAIIVLIWLRDRPFVNPPTKSVINAEQREEQEYLPSEPGVKGYFLHGYDHNGDKVRIEFTMDELSGDGQLLGRSSDAAKALPEDPQISRLHARLRLEGDTLQVVDNGPTNGTYVNGDRIPERSTRTIKTGDRVRFGPNVELKVAKLMA